MDSVYSTIEFYDNLKSKYRDYIKPEIVSVVILQSDEEVILEIVEIETIEGGFEKQTIKRTDLSNITRGENEELLFFNPKDLIEQNVRKFINEFSQYDIINATDLFHQEACEKINRRFNTFGIDK
ncbi:hypothetical protein [Clostridium grantii]|uniref:Uncharacterized protein n=1 Tax=Clostridium grantii DSM 8605 TaxID=1121316 RepID=A0A1M5XX07_9CLOT|nr:hypothetical protein [Clostridium grantii]SHI04229.1 hypothetical protein SAMN02745207_04000 [Clostridium grantii DSM 8605]